MHNNTEPLDIEKLANEACFSTHYQTKSKAQQQFFNLCQGLTTDQLFQLINNYSQTVLFVAMEQIYKVVPHAKQLRQIFLTINQSAQNWYNTNLNSTLIRPDNIPLQFHVENSVGRTLGQCLKFIYLHKDVQNWIGDFIKQRRNLRYQLYLWKLFIETVSIVDNELTFLVYRSLVYNFQQLIIPQIMDSLLPYFQSVRQQIQINDLTLMQSHLSVSEKNHQDSQMVSLFNPRSVKFTELVFQVLKQVICFNYNITYSEYESQTPIDNCLVCFPELVTKKVSNKQFISSIYFVAQKLINDNYEKSALNNNFLQTTVECIQKIMLTKLFYTSNEVKNQFIKTVLVSMTRLFNSNKLNETTLVSLIEANLKFLINFQLHIIRVHEKQYQGWISIVKTITDRVLFNSLIYIDNQLVSESLELIVKIIQDSSSPQLKEQSNFYKKLGFQAFHLLLEKLFTQDFSLIGPQKIRNYQDLKKNLAQFLKRVRQLCCLNFYQNLQKIQTILLNILSTGNTIQISNTFFFFSQLCEGAVLQRNILYQSAQPQACFLYGRILTLLLEWIATYRSMGQAIQQIQVSLLIFTQRLLSEALSYFTSQQNQIKITSQVFKYISESQQHISSEDFLTFCYNQIARSLINSDFIRASYTFEVLTSLLLKFKWGIKRQLFKQTAIAQNILQLCKNLNEQHFDTEKITLRKQLYRIIANISFDDTLDDYRTSINQLIIVLTQNLKQHKWRVMYDLTGICQAIDTSAIYRYFMVSLEKSQIPINVIMTQLFGGIEAASNGDQNSRLELVKSILKLQLSMIENKGQRLGGSKNTYYNYKLIGILMPYWVQLLSMPQFRSQDWDEAIIQLYKIFNTILKNSNTNFFVLERSIPSYGNFIHLLLQNMINITTWIEQYPQIFEEYRLTMSLMSKQLMEVFFCNKNYDVVRCFNGLINIFMGFNISAIESVSQGNKSMEQLLQNYLEILKSIFKYLQNARKLQHRTIQLSNIIELNTGLDIKYNYILALFKFGISHGKKNYKVAELVCKIIFNMNFLAVKAIEEVSGQLGLTEIVTNQLLNIWKQAEESKQLYGEDVDQNQFIVNLREWFKKCNTSTMIQHDY